MIVILISICSGIIVFIIMRLLNYFLNNSAIRKYPNLRTIQIKQYRYIWRGTLSVGELEYIVIYKYRLSEKSVEAAMQRCLTKRVKKIDDKTKMKLNRKIKTMSADTFLNINKL